MAEDSTPVDPAPAGAAVQWVDSDASSLRVLLAQLIDTIVLLSVGSAFAVLEGWIRNRAVESSTELWIDHLAVWLYTNADAALHGFIIAVALGLFFATARAFKPFGTPGRWLTRTQIRRRSGKPMSWPLAITRAILALPSLALFGAGFFWSVVDEKGRTWHDVLTRTRLVRVRRA